MPRLNATTSAAGKPADSRHPGLVILRRPQVQADCGYSRSTIYLRISQGLWTRAVSLGARSVGWPAHEVEALNAARIAGLSDQKIRELVIALEAARKDTFDATAWPRV